jgi:Flp pilus assembly protein protease CpaA
MAFAAFATVASLLTMVGLRFITSLNGTRVSNRIVLVVFFMSHLLEMPG